MTTNSAHSASEPDPSSDLRPVPASKKQVAAEQRPTRNKRPRAKKATRTAQPRLDRQQEQAGTLAKLEQSMAPRGKTQVGTLLVGAGIGAAVTLSVVAFGTKRGRSSVFALAVTKSLSYAIARTTERGSLINLVAQAVGSAIA